MAEGKSVQQTVEMLTRKLELLGAEKQGTFCVDCETYHTAASTMGNQGARRGGDAGRDGEPPAGSPQKGRGRLLAPSSSPRGLRFSPQRSAVFP